MPSNPNPATPQDEIGTREFPTIAHPRPTVRVEIGATTHPGRVRPNNEDNYLVARLAKSMRICKSSLPEPKPARAADEEGYLFVVADGMGGAAAGERASALAVRTVEAFALDTLKWFLHLQGRDENELLAELREAIERADHNVIERAMSDPALHGMGTTLTMAYSVGTDLYIVHAGDSRAYRFRGGEIVQLTSDHTLVQMLVDGGELSPEDARHHRRRNVVTNVVGGPREGVHTEIHKFEIRDGDIVLLCSDGLTEPVPDPEIGAILSTASDPDAACRGLQDLALERGAPDNVTIVVARYRVGAA